MHRALRDAFPVCIVVLCSLVTVPGALRGQAAREITSSATPTIEAELAELNRTLSRIADLLEREAETGRLGLVLQRVGLESDRIGDLEGELRTLESSKRSLEDERFRIQSRLESFAEHVETAPPDMSPETLRAMESEVSGAERMLERFESQIDDAEARIAEIENELVRRRADLEALRDHVDRELQGD